MLVTDDQSGNRLGWPPLHQVDACPKLPRPNGQTGRTLWHARGPHRCPGRCPHSPYANVRAVGQGSQRASIPALLLPNARFQALVRPLIRSRPAARVLPVDRLDFRRESEQSQLLTATGQQRVANWPKAAGHTRRAKYNTMYQFRPSATVLTHHGSRLEGTPDKAQTGS